MALTSIFKSSTGEQRWITQISEILEKEVKIVIDHPVSIFRVPATLTVFKPEAYVPQVIGLGPYHHFRPELYEMERYKLASASRLQQAFKTLEFKQLVNGLNELEHRVRACYHRYLDIEGETLAWIMAIDGLFLLEFLRCYNLHPSITTAHLTDSTGRKLAHESVLGDILMLENQIPIFVLSTILSIQCSNHLVANDLFTSTLMDFCKALSPLKIQEDVTLLSKVPEHAHLLDLLYHLIVPKLEGSVESCNIYGECQDASFEQNLSLDSSKATQVFKKLSLDSVESCNIYGECQDASFEQNLSLDSSKATQVFKKLWSLLSNLNVGFISKITKPVTKIIGVSGKIISSVPGVSIFASSKNKEDIKPENAVSNEEKKIPMVEEIMIPSVSHLSFVGVEFCPTTGGITTVKFDQNTKKLYLPVITLNVNSEVVMRNLVAYEASVASESLVFTRYTELMNGIIDTAEDVKLLREKKIIVNSLKSDADVAKVFNGMSKSVRLTNVPFIDKTIEDVNKHFNTTPAVMVYRRIKNFVYGSWQILTIFAVVLLMLLMVIQSFCSVYSCPKLLNSMSE